MDWPARVVPYASLYHRPGGRRDKAYIRAYGVSNSLILRADLNWWPSRAILIRVAIVGYGRQPDYELVAPGQWTHEQRVAYVMKNNPILREAQKKESIDPDKVPDVETLPGWKTVPVKSKL